MNLTDRTPVEIDTELFEIYEKLGKAEHYRDNYRQMIEDRPESVQVRQWEKALAEIERDIDAFEAEAEPFESEYDRRPWARYIVVPRGHLHRRSCSTLTPGRTMVGQVAEASGMTAEQVVERFKITACTHCFPDAPVAPKLTPEQEGFCPMSGVSINAVELSPEAQAYRDQLVRRYGDEGWHNLAVAPGAKCSCGGYPAITSTGKIRKHKPGSPK